MPNENTDEPTTKTYYFGIPLEYAQDYDKTTMMFAFEVYGKRDVSEGRSQEEMWVSSDIP